MSRLKDKVAVITGGASGIGWVTAQRFAKEGAIVQIWDVQVEKGKAAVEKLKSEGFPADFYEVNTASWESVLRSTQFVYAKHSRIDILINNAGITRDATLAKMSIEDWQKVIDVNLTGVFNCSKAVSAIMTETGYGRIINTSSVVALYGNFGQSNYVAAKSALIGVTKVWAKELGKKGITVNAVAPGFIETDMIKTVPEKVIQGIVAKTPVQRLGKPEEIASAYVFLSSDEAAYINGHCLSVDGGITL
ncbi:MAG: beta-ketoacyl-ACP reductase [Bacteroidetes bacterium]|nr:beta-ketoacyl-ACP reductase [Bacteroidota bacterium]